MTRTVEMLIGRSILADFRTAFIDSTLGMDLQVSIDEQSQRKGRVG